MKVVRARQRVPFPRIDRENGLMGAAGRTRGFAALFSEQGDLPRGAYYLERR